jgi:biotin carboxylase
MPLSKIDNRKKILFVNWGTRDKKYPFEVAKNKGLNTFLATTKNYPDWILDYFDKGNLIITNPYDSQKLITDVVAFCVNNKIIFDAVLTFFEMSIIPAADLADSLGCNSVSSKAVRRSSGNKALMRFFSEIKGINSPRFYIVNSKKQLNIALKKIGTPVILKPVISGRSYGAIKIDSLKIHDVNKSLNIAKKQLYGNFDEWMKYYKDYKKDFIVEKYIKGKVISVDGLIQNDKVYIVGTAEHVMCSEPMLFQTGLYIPARISTKAEKNAMALAKKIINKMEFNNCAFHSEYRVYKDNPILIEFAVRPPGGTMIQSYNKAYGIDIADKLLEIVLSNKINIKRSKLKKYIIQRSILLPYPGVIKQIIGLDRIKKIRELTELSSVRSNEYIDFPYHVPQTGLYFQLESEDEELLKKREKFIVSNIKFIYKDKLFNSFWHMFTYVRFIIGNLKNTLYKIYKNQLFST